MTNPMGNLFNQRGKYGLKMQIWFKGLCVKQSQQILTSQILPKQELGKLLNLSTARGNLYFTYFQIIMLYCQSQLVQPKSIHYGPPLFFWLCGHQKPKTEPWHIFGTKNYLKSHFEHFQVPQFSHQRAKNYNPYYSRKIQNFPNSEFPAGYAPQMKAKNMYNSN